MMFITSSWAFGQGGYMAETSNQLPGGSRAQPEPPRRAEAEKSCTLDDVVALVPQSAMYAVDAVGDADYYLDTCEADLQEVEEYHCSNCGTLWAVGEGYETKLAAWQAVSAHFGESERV